MRGLLVASIFLLKREMAIGILVTALFIALYHSASCMGAIDHSYVVFIAAASLSSAFSMSMLSISKWVESGWVKFILSTFGNPKAIKSPIIAAISVPVLANCILLLSYALINPQITGYMISGMLIMILSLSALAACTFAFWSYSRNLSPFESAAVISPVIGVAAVFVHVFRLVAPNEHILGMSIAAAAITVVAILIISECRFDPHGA